jgi:hypothetical protein
MNEHMTNLVIQIVNETNKNLTRSISESTPWSASGKLEMLLEVSKQDSTIAE